MSDKLFFFYGSLRDNGRFNWRVRGLMSQLSADVITVDRFALASFRTAAFPFIVRASGGYRILGELWSTTEENLSTVLPILDEIEGQGFLYNRYEGHVIRRDTEQTLTATIYEGINGAFDVRASLATGVPVGYNLLDEDEMLVEWQK